MDLLNQDDIFLVLLLNAMNKNFGPFQQSIYSLLSLPNFHSEMIVNHMLDEDSLIHCRIELGQAANPYIISPSIPSPSSAFPTFLSCSRSPRPLCTNCKREGHPVDYCISPGGKMSGCSIDEAHAAQAAQQAAHAKQQPSHNHPACPPYSSNSAHITSNPSANSSTPATTSLETIYINGLPYIPNQMLRPWAYLVGTCLCCTYILPYMTRVN